MDLAGACHDRRARRHSPLGAARVGSATAATFPFGDPERPGDHRVAHALGDHHAYRVAIPHADAVADRNRFALADVTDRQPHANTFSHTT